MMIPGTILAATLLETFAQQCITGLTTGSLIALIALGYTMVYGIIGLINFAHGDLFMLGSLLALTLAGLLGLGTTESTGMVIVGVALMMIVSAGFCAGLNVAIDRVVYRPLRDAPKLAPLVSAIGVSFVLMNLGMFWIGPQDTNFPDIVPAKNLLGEGSAIRFTQKDLLVICTTVPILIGLNLLVNYTKLGKAMRAVEQDPKAAQLMGVDVDHVIFATFGIGGALAGAASVIYGLYVNTLGFQMGYTNGLYAFTAAVLGGIGNLPGAVLGGLVIGLVRALGTAYLGEQWTGALIFVILIVILVFRPAGLLGEASREKV